ncbi:MAG: type II secretion system minor pseudopilin GspK [Thauera propionica]|jgi:general secretion pathway protein K|nr:type II secretion system minor pseudopilin GspK [Thauera propionica]
MPAPCYVCSRCAEGPQRRQRGAAVILALLTVSLAAILAAAALADFGYAYDLHAGRYEQAQSRQLALGALDWARNVLAEDRRTSTSDHGGEIWAISIPPTPIEEDPASGVIGGHILDLSGRFDLNALHPSRRQHAAARTRCERLFALVLGNPVMAEQLVATLDAHLRTPRAATDPSAATSATIAHGPQLFDTDELLRLPGFAPEIVSALAPHVSALPGDAALNANTATPEVLAAVIEGLGLDQARILAAERERVWYRNLGDLNGRLGEGVVLPSQSVLDVRSRFFRVHIHAAYGEALTRLNAVLDREQNWPNLLWYRYE